MPSEISIYEKNLEVRETPTQDFFIRALDQNEESVRIPFNKVGLKDYCDVNFIAFEDGTPKPDPFAITEGTTIYFEDRVNSSKPIFTYKWTLFIGDPETDPIILYQKNPSHRFTVPGTYSVRLEVMAEDETVLGTKLYPSYIIVSESSVNFFSLTITVKDADTTDPIEGAVVAIGSGKSQLTPDTGIVVFNGILENTNLTYLVSKAGYRAKVGSIIMNSNKEIDVMMDPEVIPPPPEEITIYFGWATIEDIINEDRILGTTDPEQQEELDTTFASPLFPNLVAIPWKNTFDALSPWETYVFWFAFPLAHVPSNYAYYRDTNMPLIGGLVENIANFADVEVGGEDYRVCILDKNPLAPVNYSFSVNPF